MRFLKKLKRFFGLEEKEPIKEIKITREAMDKIILLAKENHPNEFVTFFEGKIKDGTIIIEDVLFQPYYANDHSVFTHIDFPLTSKVLGSIHSHPGPSNRPSRADLHLFGKTGIVHGIIHEPYTEGSLAMYDNNGEPLIYSVEQRQ